MEAIIHGFVLAFGLILPLGVQNVFVFTQGASQPSLLKAFPATITAALCDTLLILLAIFGLSMLVLQFESLRIILMIVGIVFLLYMGYSIWTSQSSSLEESKPLPPSKQVFFALSVSLLNPHALLDTVGVIGTSALIYEGSERLLFTTACIFVSWCWFIGLTIAGATLKKIDNSGRLMLMFNKASAIFIWCTAVYLATGLI